MKIGIVVPAIDLWSKFTETMLNSIKSKHELYVVFIDNGSKDETFREATKLITQSFHYKRNEENWGCAKSWNYGVRDCLINHSCNYVLIANNDVIFHPNAIDRLVERFEKKELEVVMVTCLNTRGEVSNPHKVITLDDRIKSTVPESEHPDFSAFMINKKCWDEVGEFDEAFSILGKAYFEDNDYHYRIKLAGLKAIVYPLALYYHYGSQTQNRDLTPLTAIQKGSLFEANRGYYITKWGGSSGEEKFTHPTNDEKKSIKWTFQDSQKE
jgi:GT2 family glycosyltransferase